MRQVPRLLAVLPLALLVAGCSFTPKPTGATSEAVPTGLTGAIHGGQQPVSGATVTLMAPGTSTYGSSASLIATTTSGPTGGFTLPAYTCPTNSGLVYLLATGGNSGSGNNPSLVEAALLGPCSQLRASDFFSISEVTTVAAAYALAPFASVSTSGTRIGVPLSNVQGLVNAMGPYSNLVNPQTGFSRAPLEIAGLVLPQAELNTLADILASCVNSSGSTLSTQPCGMLFIAATPAGGSAPLDTFQAALNIALNPGTNVPALYGMATAAVPYLPVLGTQPTDFAVGLQYTGGGIAGSYGTQGVAIDALGNAWITTGNVGSNAGSTHTLTVLTPAGVYQSGNAGYGSAAMTAPEGIAIDASGNVYVTDVYAEKVLKFASNGSLLSTFAPSSLSAPLGIAIDTDGTLWVANTGAASVSHLTAAGADASGSPYATLASAQDVVLNTAGNWLEDFGAGINGYLTHYADVHPTQGEVSYSETGHPAGVALDSSGNVWFSVDGYGNGISRVNANGVINLTPVTIATLAPQDVFVDGLNHIWVSAYNPASLSASGALLEYSDTGSLLSPSGGFLANGIMPPSPGFPEGLAVDGSGNLWLTGSYVDKNGNLQANATVTELIGIAAPVVTPIAVAASSGALGTRP